MNQEKIGKFILELRKEKNMTQQDLANKLGVTDRAISKWENGRGLPDLSLIKPLCDELDISINELLTGVRLNKDEYSKRLEENILNTLDYSDVKIKKTKKVFMFISLSILLIVGFLITAFCIDINRMNNNEPVVFSTWGFKYAPPIDLHVEYIEMAISNYLVNKSLNDPVHHQDEKGFVSFKTLLIEEKDSYYNIYAWVIEEKYYLENKEIKKDSGSSMPYKFIVQKNDNEYVVSDSRTPRDGSLYKDDIENIFPNTIHDDLDLVYYDGTIERLQLDIQKQVKLYFHQ